mmetsp:Transcript_7493/g.27535  ORF Transcript_7493/g.27535 Transcript_7493/m.27535 type:complete len:114 (-) Transcript_7493:696-1037(-)
MQLHPGVPYSVSGPAVPHMWLHPSGHSLVSKSSGQFDSIGGLVGVGDGSSAQSPQDAGQKSLASSSKPGEKHKNPSTKSLHVGCPHSFPVQKFIAVMTPVASSQELHVLQHTV